MEESFNRNVEENEKEFVRSISEDTNAFNADNTAGQNVAINIAESRLEDVYSKDIELMNYLEEFENNAERVLPLLEEQLDQHEQKLAQLLPFIENAAKREDMLGENSMQIKGTENKIHTSKQEFLKNAEKRFNNLEVHYKRLAETVEKLKGKIMHLRSFTLAGMDDVDYKNN
jgi:exonuclease VII large subunit